MLLEGQGTRRRNRSSSTTTKEKIDLKEVVQAWPKEEVVAWFKASGVWDEMVRELGSLRVEKKEKGVKKEAPRKGICGGLFVGDV